MPVNRPYPAYTTLSGKPNSDPYYITPEEEREIEAEAQRRREERRAELVDDIAETLSDTCDQDVSWARYAEAVVALLELRKLVDWDKDAPS
jgi:hypothetical protein